LSFLKTFLVSNVSALPPEAYSIYESYPWRFGKTFCYTKIFLQEMTSYASVLTITSFTVERYMAICHPLSLSRNIKIIIGIWVISLVCALPYTVYTEQFYFIDADKNNGTPLSVSHTRTLPFNNDVHLPVFHIRLHCLSTHDYHGPVHADSGILLPLGFTTRCITGFQNRLGNAGIPSRTICFQK